MKHNMVELRERFGNLLDALCKDFELGRYVDGRSPEDIESSWEGYSPAVDHYNIWTGSGATKLVIGDENYDYIIKFCPNGNDFDYCAREVEVYKAAVENGFEDKFAWTDFLFYYHFNDSVCLPVYVMEYCQCSYDQIDDEMDDWHYTKFCSSHGMTKCDEALDAYLDSKQTCYNWTERMLEWAYDMWQKVYDAADEFLVFMRKMYINDLHPGNWGWNDNKLVLVDYSGYGESFSCRSIDY